MERYLSIFVIVALVACQTTQPPPKVQAPSPTPTATPEKSVSPKPVHKRKPVQHANDESTPTTEPTSIVSQTATPPPKPENYPTATRVSGKTGRVNNPFGSGEIDVNGYAPGTEVKDPSTGKIFIVP